MSAADCPLCLGSGAQCEACLNRRASKLPAPVERLIQVGWRSRVTGEICDCPVYETSPHANSEPVYRCEGEVR